MKCLICGDPDLPSQYLYSEIKKIEKYGVSLTTTDWKKNWTLDKLYSLILKIEQEGPEKVEPCEEILDQINDKEILVVHNAPVSSYVIEKGKKLKIIGCARGGYENINVNAAKERGIVVVHAPGRVAIAVADFTIGLILALLRNIVGLHNLLKKGIWKAIDREYESLPYDLNGKVLGIIGFGQVGKEVAKRAEAFGMSILIYDPYVSDALLPPYARKSDLDNLLKKSDIISIHARLTPETHHLIGEREFKLMKRSALFINTARAEIVDENALINSLKNGWIAGAALDVFKEEPLRKDHPILQFENVIVTPHSAGATRESLLINGPRIIADQIEALLQGEKAKFMI
jgi:D-3-phosphoglycerate dehydrogenase